MKQEPINPHPGYLASRQPESPRMLSTVWRKRLFWSVLLSLHIVPLVTAMIQGSVVSTATSTADLMVRLVALGGSLGFFLLKIADVSWLQLRPGRASWIASVAVVLLLHVNTVQRNVFDANPTTPVPVMATLAAGALLDPRAVRRAVRELSFQLPRLCSANTGHCAVTCRWAGWLDVVQSLLQRLLVARLSPRAPPLCPS